MSKTNWPEPSMMLTTSNWAGSASFSLIPITGECPYVEALYNPAAKTLAVIGKTKKDTFHMIPRLDDSGHPRKLKTGATAENPHQKQRVTQESYTEYYIIEKKEVENFIQNFAVNHSEFNYMSILDMKTMDTPNPAGILTGPELDEGKPTPLIKV